MLAITLAVALALPQIATPVSVSSPSAPLHGAFMEPEGRVRAAAVILPGSGPTDRDGNSPQFGVKSATYRLLAEELAGAGVATIRIDKRGIGDSAAAGGAEADLRFSDYVDDALLWTSEAARLASQRCAWLIGHSEGALVALAAAVDGRAPVCGVVLLSGPGRPLGHALREQLNAGLPEPLLTQALTILTDLEAGRTVPDVPPSLAGLFRPSVQRYLISMLGLDPQRLAAAYAGPILIGWGETDLQVARQDADALAGARLGIELAVWPGVNHVLKVAPIDRQANIAVYMSEDEPLAPEVGPAVSSFILQPRD